MTFETALLTYLKELIAEMALTRKAMEEIAAKLKECSSNGCFDITRRDP